MEWWMFLLIFFGLLFFLIFLGVHVAFAFLTVNIVTIFIIMGFESGMEMMVLSAFESIAKFTLTPIPLFVFMGELLFHSGLVVRTLDVISKMLGKLPGRLAILSVGSGTLFSALSGSSIANTSLLGTILVPEMMKRGYHPKMTIAPILASGILALVIPPSSVAVLLGSLGRIPIGDLLISGIIPGLLMAISFVGYFIYVCWRDPSMAPAYDLEEVGTLKEKVVGFFKDIFPMLLLIAVVLGSFFFGFTTPTESAAVGCIGAFILPMFYKRMNWKVFVKSLQGTVIVSGMILLIMSTAATFSQLLAFTGSTREIVSMITATPLTPMILVAIMLLIVILLGMLIEPVAIMMITLPLFIPLLANTDIDLVWFGCMMLISLGLGNLTPPFGMLLFVMKGVVPKHISMGLIYRSAMPIVILQIIIILLIFFIPSIATWLPSLGGKFS